MRNIVVRVALTCASAIAATVVLATPAQAATNPFTAAQACNNDYGGTWAHTTDGHRSITNAAGAVIGDVYLMYNSGSGYNCVVVLKRVDIGTKTGDMHASLTVEGGPTYGITPADYKYYVSVDGEARDKCVKFRGWMTHKGKEYTGGRDKWGNCG